MARSSLKEYYADITASPVLITDKRKQLIELLKLQTNSNSDQYLIVKSHTKKLKEDCMKSLLSQKFEHSIQSIHEGVSKKGGTKKLNKVYERIGRLKQKYPSVHTAYNIIVCDDGNQRATSVSCKQIATGHGNNQSGVYYLRTNIMQIDEEHTFWSIYNITRTVDQSAASRIRFALKLNKGTKVYPVNCFYFSFRINCLTRFSLSAKLD